MLQRFMLQRFAAASLVGSAVVAIAAFCVLVVPGISLQRVSPIVTAWCLAPCAWGLWAMLAPASWVPQRLPVWGTILGVAAGLLAAFVINMPARVFGEALPVSYRLAGLSVMIGFYYLLWMLVRAAYRKLEFPKTAAAAK